MFNEAFWFFYLVDVAGVARNFMFLTVSVAALSGVIVAIAGTIFACEGGEEAGRASRYVLSRICIPAVVATLLLIATPPKEAFYAGAGQYVAESTEVDETLLRLKRLIDKKIEEAEAE